MRRLKNLWRSALSPRVCEELETWTQVLLALGAGVLLFVTLKAQTTNAQPRSTAATLESPIAAGAGFGSRHEACVALAPARARPPELSANGRSS
jgi:hypothetical protein